MITCAVCGQQVLATDMDECDVCYDKMCADCMIGHMEECTSGDEDGIIDDWEDELE